MDVRVGVAVFVSGVPVTLGVVGAAVRLGVDVTFTVGVLVGPEPLDHVTTSRGARLALFSRV